MIHRGTPITVPLPAAAGSTGSDSKSARDHVLKKLVIGFLKITVSLAILAYLIASAQRTAVFANLRDQPKNWGLLSLAAMFCASAVLTTFLRWRYLVRALDLPFTLSAALRLGFLGYLFNLAPMGIVGGDFLKVVMLARHQKGQYAKAVASVVVDRLMGLYVLFVVAAAAICLTGFRAVSVGNIRAICDATLAVAIGGGVVFGLLMLPLFARGSLAQWLQRVPRVGHHLASLVEAVQMYRRKPRVLLVAALMSVAVHCLFSTGVYFVAHGLPGNTLSLATHFVVMPLSAAAGVIPLPMGPFEAVLDALYVSVPVPAGVVIAKGQGLVVALGYRIITLLIATIGIVYYLGSRREVAEVMHEAQRGERDQAPPPMAAAPPPMTMPPPATVVPLAVE